MIKGLAKVMGKVFGVGATAGLVLGCATIPKGYSVEGDEYFKRRDVVVLMNKLAGICTGTAGFVSIKESLEGVGPYGRGATRTLTGMKGFYFPFLDNGKALRRVYEMADEVDKDGVIHVLEYFEAQGNIYMGFWDICSGRKR